MMIFKKKTGKQTPNENGRIHIGGRARRLLAESTQIEEELIPAFVRPLLIMVGVIGVLSLLWAALTNLTEVARAQGELVPSGQVKVVEHLDGGIVSEIKVEDRSLVEEGQELLRIDGAQTIADLRQAEVRLISLRLRSERLSAFAEGRTPHLAEIAGTHSDLLMDQQQIYRTQIEARNSTLSILDPQINQRTLRIHQLETSLEAARKHQAINGELSSMRANLASRHLVNRSVLLETQGAQVTADSEAARLTEEIGVIKQELAETQNRRADSINQMRRDALNEMGAARAEIAEVEEMIRRLRDKVDRLVVRSPTRGYVHDLKVHTVGQVVQPGALLMQVVPVNAPLEAVIRISSRDIGYVKEGQEVNMRVSSYDFTKFGFARGTLKKVSATNMVDNSNGNNGTPYFQGWVTLTHPYVGDKPGPLLEAGMGVEAEILTGHRTLLAYLLKPLTVINSSSFNER
jgi:HlyD family type I secretion membrane fusion protein